MLFRMSIVISHSTAFQYWIRTGNTSPGKPRDPRFAPLPIPESQYEFAFVNRAPKLDNATRHELDVLGISTDGLHFTVFDNSMRRTIKGTHCHVENVRLPPDSIYRISENVYITSPELTFLQICSDVSLSHEKLVFIGYTLCGNYALVPNKNGKTDLIQDISRTDVERTRLYLDEVTGINTGARKLPRGIHTARRALKYVLGSVESPLEAQTAILVFLPFAMGGGAAGKPECNGIIKLPEKLMRGTGRSHFRGDYLFREEKLVIEVNGAIHANPCNVVRDAEKYNALSRGGYDIILVSKKHVYDPKQTDILIDQVRKSLHLHDRPRPTNFKSKQAFLRREIGINW